MYMNLLGKPTDADLATFPHVLLTGPDEWDPSILDYTHPATAGDPTWPPITANAMHMTPGLMNLATLMGDFTTLSLIPCGKSNIAQHKHAIKTQPIDFEKLRPYFGWVCNLPQNHSMGCCLH